MALSGALRELSTVVGRIEQEGYVVSEMKPQGDALLTDESVNVELSVKFPLADHLADGTCAEIGVGGCDVQGAIPATLSVQVPIEEAESAVNGSHRLRMDGLPKYKDPEALRDVYDRFETFEDMTNELDVDVSPSTVRRHMIKCGIHVPEPMYEDTANEPETVEEEKALGDAPVEEPTSSDAEDGSSSDHDTSPSDPVDADVPTTTTREEATNSTRQPEEESTPTHPGEESTATQPDEGNDDETPPELLEARLESNPAVTDGIGLPEHLTLDDMIEIVRTSETLFEARRQMDVDPACARRVLNALDLMEFVTGRVATKAERDVSKDVIADRIATAIQMDAAG